MSQVKRAVVIGARRKRQGTGPFVASSFVKAGANVCGVVGTSQHTVELACQELKTLFNIECRGYVSLEQALQTERPDILAICSPYEAHLEALEIAAALGIHCLCEKPLWWGSNPERMKKTIHLLDAFQKKHCFLQTITQWPYTLSYFYKIFPEEKDKTVTRFEMELSPRKLKRDIIPDSGPHLFSMLYALAGSGKIINPQFQRIHEERKHWEISFLYHTQKTDIETTFDLIQVEKPPRPAAYAINKKEIRRKIRLPDYSWSFEDKRQSYPVEDPLDLLIGDFLEKVYSQNQLDFERLYCEMDGLETLVASFEPQINSLKDAESVKKYE